MTWQIQRTADNLDTVGKQQAALSATVKGWSRTFDSVIDQVESLQSMHTEGIHPTARNEIDRLWEAMDEMENRYGGPR